MNSSRLSYHETVAAFATAVVVVTGVISLNNDWGLMAVSLLAGIGAVGVIFLPLMAARVVLPGSKGSLLVALGAIATVATAVVAVTGISRIGSHIAELDTIQFLLGLVAAVVMTWAGWQILRAEGGKFQVGMSRTPPPPPPTMPPSEPMPPA